MNHAGPRVIWTAAGIGARLNVSADFVKTVLAKAPGSPIQRLGKRFFVVEDDLMAFMRQPNPPKPTPAR